LPGHFCFDLMVVMQKLWLRSLRPLFWGALLFSYVCAVMPDEGAPSFGEGDKTDHVMAFLVLTLLASMAYPRRSRGTIGVGLSFYGAFIEFSQAMPIVGRDADVTDWIADTAAIIVGIVIGVVLRRVLPGLFFVDRPPGVDRLPREAGAPKSCLPLQKESASQKEFEALAKAGGFDPDDLWVGGYAEYEWHHLRHLLAAYAIDIDGADVLEFGCNVGGSSVVLAALGANLSAVDIDPDMVALTRANLARHGLTAQLHHVADTRTMAFPDASFDFILANSVFEYVEPAYLNAIVAELHRLLRPGGRLLVCGTANRLALRERHSGRWLVNYTPKAFDNLIGKPLQRGLHPGQLARATAGRLADATGEGWSNGRALIHGRLALSARLAQIWGDITGRSPGWLTPYIEVLFRKP